MRKVKRLPYNPVCFECGHNALRSRAVIFETKIFCSPTCLTAFHSRFMAALELEWRKEMCAAVMKEMRVESIDEAQGELFRRKGHAVRVR